MAKMFNYERESVSELKAHFTSRSMFNKRATFDMSLLYSMNSSSFSILLMKVSALSHISLHIRTMHILSIPVSGTYLARCYVDVSESGVTFEYYLFLRGWVISPRQVESFKNVCINSHNSTFFIEFSIMSHVWGQLCLIRNKRSSMTRTKYLTRLSQNGNINSNYFHWCIWLFIYDYLNITKHSKYNIICYYLVFRFSI